MKAKDVQSAVKFLEETKGDGKAPTTVRKELYDLMLVTYGPEWLEKRNVVVEKKLPEVGDE